MPETTTASAIELAAAETHDAAHAVEGAAAQAADAAHAHHGRHVTHPPELPHFIQLWFQSDYKELKKKWENGEEGTNPYGDPGHGDGPLNGLTLKQVLHVGPLEKPVPFVNYAPWENNVFALIAALILCTITMVLTRPFRSRSREELMRKPTRAQSLMEGLVEGTLGFVQGVLGPENGRKFLPFLTTMFFLILAMNLMGIIPLMKAPSSSLLITGSLALCTFLYYFYVALTKLGPWELFKHLCGSPESAVQWALAPLMIIIECISFFVAKPLSLALRLFGNILGKDILLGVMLLLGLMMTGGFVVGVPLTFPFYFLALLLSAIQALVFSMLSAIYILMCLPHDHDHGHDDAHGHGDHHAAAAHGAGHHH
jgi:F-type H+-transporting ATPase subunit a